MKPDLVPTGPDLPAFWSEARFEYANTEIGAFGHVSYMYEPVADSKSWYGYCALAWNQERFADHFSTAAEAIEAVEQFVRTQLGFRK